ncbi:hypothetical protein CspeluHIS016_0106520 [Cutaneotrichosporon spelunceum]|uniref:Uncharacterized protein n=1 Tax=Cutaneotrichosporon spelunceum TaxID=1672016 RepID=A0AAD3Y8C7_9TREE|nr:hypothetical protein CspeluHIS016_0106520 [Cutaneotrichosporon spelunceum]
MRAGLPLRQARREVQGMIMIFRETAVSRSPIRSHPGPPLPSDTNPWARDPPAPPEDITPAGVPAWHLKSRERRVGNSNFVDYKREQVPMHGVPPNFPDDQLEGRRRIPSWAVWFGGIFLLSVIEDIVAARAKEARRRDAEVRGEAEPGRHPQVQKDEHGNEVRVADWEERSDRMRTMNTQRARVEEQARRVQRRDQQNQWGDSPEPLGVDNVQVFYPLTYIAILT